MRYGILHINKFNGVRENRILSTSERRYKTHVRRSVQKMNDLQKNNNKEEIDSKNLGMN
jgi:hypothetical protein